MKIPLFDLDGTLLVGGNSNKVHRSAYDYAIQTIFQLPSASVNEITTDGMIDSQIIMTVAMLHGVTEFDAIKKLSQALQAENTYFKLHKTQHSAIAHEGAKELLLFLEQSGVYNGVLTGNTEPIGWEKLLQAGLKDYISFGAFGNMAMKRAELIPIAQKIYKEKFDEDRPITDFVIIGDTPKDIQCAKDGGIPVIAVPTGNYSKEELEKEKPDLLIDTLKNKEEIINFLHA